MLRNALRVSFALLVLANVVACGERGERVSLVLQLAPDSPSPAACADVLPPGGESCIGVSVCRLMPDGRCDPVSVVRTDVEDHEDPAAERGELRFRDLENVTQIAFDLRLPRVEGMDAGIASTHRLQVRVYSSTGDPLLVGRAVVRDGQQEVVVRLRPYGEWSCAGPRDVGDTTSGEVRARALHRAVTLDGGDVLLLGGLAGVRFGLATGVALQTRVEVYRADVGRFQDVEVVDSAGEPVGGFGRVSFSVAYLGREGSRHRLRAFGGLTTADLPVGRLRQAGLDGVILDPVRPGSPDLPETVVEAPPVELVYDEENRTLSIERELRGVTGPVNALVDRVGSGTTGATYLIRDVVPRIGQPAGVDDGTRVVRYTHAASTSLEEIARPVGDPPRVGATMTELPDGSLFVFGGDLGTVGPEGAERRQPAWVLTEVGAPVVPLAPMFGSSVALHTATLIGSRVLIFGGLPIPEDSPLARRLPCNPELPCPGDLRCDGAPEGHCVAPERAFVTWIEGDTLQRSAVVGAPEPTIFHATLALPGRGVLVVGGGEQRLVDGVYGSLWSTDRVGLVERLADDSYVYSTLPPLTIGRWGHSVSLLENGTVLVTGGFRRDNAPRPTVCTEARDCPANDEVCDATAGQCREDGAFEFVNVAEVYEPAVPPPSLTGGACEDGPPIDGGGLDAGRPDAGRDAGRLDAALHDGATPPAMDAGPGDAG